MNDKVRPSAPWRSQSDSQGAYSQATSQTPDDAPGDSWIARAIVQYESPLLRYAKHFVGDIETARDVVQDTFLQLCRNADPELRPRIAQWLYTVCRNRAIDVIRKESRMKQAPENQTGTTGLRNNPIADPADEQPGPGQLVEQAEDACGLMEQIKRLPDRQQEILRLKFHGGLSYKEIAEVMELTSTNVGFILHSAIAKLRQQMAQIQ